MARPEPIRKIRCAIYTRKSTDEGLDQEFNSLDAQREAAEAYVASQRHEGWVALASRYDDGGHSGGTLARPAMQRLLADVECGNVDCVVVYKVDRLSRSLLDFSKIVELFERRGVSFVSVTQQFNTTTSMGRLTLNILLSFAQFEREIIGERIRDKVAAAKRKGKYTGGMPILGYDVDPVAKRLIVNPEEAKLVVHVFKRFRRLGSSTRLAAELNEQGHRTKQWTTKRGRVAGGYPWNKGHLYRLLNNRKYVGQVTHKGAVYPGEHEPIVPQALWDDVHRILAENHKVRGNRTRAKTPALLKGIIRCGHCESAMGPTFTRKKGKTYRYYLCVHASKTSYAECPVKTVAAGVVEEAVVEQLRAVFRTPELIARTFREAKTKETEEVARLRARREELAERVAALRDAALRLVQANGNGSGALVRQTESEIEDASRQLAQASDELAALESAALTERDVAEALRVLDPAWEELFPGEQTRVVQLLVDRVTVRANGLDVRLRSDGLRSLVGEIGAREEEVAAT